MNEQSRFLPDLNRIGLILSIVLLTLTLGKLIPTGGFDFTIPLSGFLIQVPLNFSTILNILVAGLAASGMDWLLRGHPALNGRATFQWWLLPTLTTFIVSTTVSILPDGRSWWIGFFISSIFIFFVFLAEYIIVDPDAPFYTISVTGLTAISYALFFILTIALRAGNVRFTIVVPSLFITATITALRILHLQIRNTWETTWSIGIGVVCAQLAGSLHFWPLTSIQFGLVLMGPVYGLVTLAINLNENMQSQRAVLTTCSAIGICLILAISIR